MQPELKQLLVNIIVLFTVVVGPILLVVGAYRGLQAFGANTRRQSPSEPQRDC